MAQKVTLLSENQEKSEKIRRVVAEYLVRQLLAVQVTKYLYRRVLVRPAAEVSASPISYSEPARSSHAPRLKWEPPKAKRPLKGHPFTFMQADEMERLSHREA